jgi:hypothetical protein
MINNDDALSKLTQVPAIVKIDGKEWKLSPHRLIEQKELDKWIEDWPINRVRQLIATHPDIPKERQEQLWRLATELSQDPSIVTEALVSAEGTGMMLWLSMRINHPQLTLVQIMTMFDAINVREVKKVLNSINAMTEDRSGVGPDNIPAADLTVANDPQGGLGKQ